MIPEQVGEQSAKLDLAVRAVEWLEEQQKSDREQIALGLDQAERLGQLTRELTSRLDALEGERGQHRALGARVLGLEDAASGLREAAAELRQSIEVLQKQSEHQILLRSAEVEHERRGSSELAQQVGDLRRQNESLQSRLQATAEELRRDRAAADQFPVALDAVTRQIASLVSRTQQLEDYRRRADDQASILLTAGEQVRGDVTKLDNWQRLADVRWTRLNSELQEQAQSIKHQVEEQAKPVQQIGRLAKQVQEEVAGHSAQFQDLRKRMDEQFVSLERLGGQIGTLREGATRIEQAIEAQRRRIDEQAASLFRLDEAQQRSVAATTDLAGRLELLDTRIDGVLSQVRVVESQRQRDEQGLGVQQQLLRELRLSFAEELATTRAQIAAEIRSLSQRVGLIGQAELHQRQRVLSAAQQDVEEWSGISRDDHRPDGAAESEAIGERRRELAN